MKHREKPKYSVRQNVCFMVRTAWEKRRRVLLLCVVVAAIKVALDLAQLYVTPEILTRVEQGVPVGELLTTIFHSGTSSLTGGCGVLRCHPDAR